MTNWRAYGRIPYDIWHDTILAAGGPAELADGDVWAAAGEHSALALAMLRAESSYATHFNANRPENKNPLNLRPPSGGGYMAFITYEDAIRAWRERITSETYKGGIYAKTITLEDLIHVYAPSSDNNNEAAYAATVKTLFLLWGVTPKGDPMPTKPTILVIAGHRSYGDAGNPNEKALTPALARSYRDAFRKAGYACEWLQGIDGDADPDDTAGGLDTVSAKAAQWIARQPGDCILLDLHYEGSPARGCFAIIPDVTGLRTNAPAFQDPSDTWANNARDRELGRALVNGIAALTGLPLRQGIREPGLMDEHETGVGADGWRLATFAYTSPYVAKCVRLVVEHGNHTHPEDAKIIARPDFTERCAAAAVKAVNAVYGVTQTDAEPKPEPKPRPRPGPINWTPGRDFGLGELNGTPVYRLLAEVRATRGTQPRAGASAKTRSVGSKVKAGDKVKIVGTLDSGWLFMDGGDGTYPRVSGKWFKPALPKPKDC